MINDSFNGNRGDHGSQQPHDYIAIITIVTIFTIISFVTVNSDVFLWIIYSRYKYMI